MVEVHAGPLPVGPGADENDHDQVATALPLVGQGWSDHVPRMVRIVRAEKSD